MSLSPGEFPSIIGLIISSYPYSLVLSFRNSYLDILFLVLNIYLLSSYFPSVFVLPFRFLQLCLSDLSVNFIFAIVLISKIFLVCFLIVPLFHSFLLLRKQDLIFLKILSFP